MCMIEPLSHWIHALSSLILALAAIYAAIEWSGREKWIQDQKDARIFLRKLAELKFYIEARPYKYLRLTDSLLAEYGIRKKVNKLTEEEIGKFKVEISYYKFLEKIKEYKIDLRVIKETVHALAWKGDFEKNIGDLEVLLRALELHIENRKKDISHYFYFDIEMYKQEREKGKEVGDAFRRSTEFLDVVNIPTDKEENKKFIEKKSKSSTQNINFLLSRSFDGSAGGNPYDEEVDRVFNNLFALLGEKIKRKDNIFSRIIHKIKKIFSRQNAG